MSWWLCLFLGVLCTPLPLCRALHYSYNGMEYDVRVTELMVEIGDGEDSCFFMQGTKDDPMQLEFEVVEGGNMDIDYTIKDPDGNTMKFDEKVEDAHYEVSTLPMAGGYQLCFSNEMSRLTHKKVFFRWTMGRDIGDFIDDIDPQKDANDPEYRVLELDSLNILQNLEDIKDYMDHARNFEHRHRFRVENLNTRVWIWSFATTVVVIGVSMIQVHLVKGLFNTR